MLLLADEYVHLSSATMSLLFQHERIINFMCKNCCLRLTCDTYTLYVQVSEEGSKSGVRNINTFGMYKNCVPFYFCPFLDIQLWRESIR